MAECHYYDNGVKSIVKKRHALWPKLSFRKYAGTNKVVQTTTSIVLAVFSILKLLIFVLYQISNRAGYCNSTKKVEINCCRAFAG